MKRDVTVWLSLVFIFVPWCIGTSMGMTNTINDDDPILFHVFFGIMILGWIRAAILWFQTLIHGIKYAKDENRVAVVLAHIFLSMPMSYLYYLTIRLDSKRQKKHPEEHDLSSLQETRMVK